MVKNKGFSSYLNGLGKALTVKRCSCLLSPGVLVNRDKAFACLSHAEQAMRCHKHL
jgi:hypothetical protein